MKRRYSYKDLYRMVFGDGEGNKGLLRERDFTLEVLSGWRSHADFLAELMKQDRAAIQRVRDLHQRLTPTSEWCRCDIGYPCPTIKALEIEK